MTEHDCRLDLDGATAWVTLSRGDRNLLDAPMTRWLHETLTSLQDDPQVTVVVLTGAGEYFCAGADGPHLRESGTAKEFAAAAVDLFSAIPKLRTPIIAAVNGDALAGGFGVVCATDIVLAVEGSRLGTIEASLGSWPMIAQVPASRRVPAKAALRNALTGIPFDAREALGLGIVDGVVAAEELTDAARTYALLVAQGGVAMQRGRALFYESTQRPYDEALRVGADAFVSLFSP